MNLKQYTEWTENTCATLPNQSIERLESNFLNNVHMVLGISTEAGELEDVFKKHLAYGKKIDWVNVREEIGDIMYYIGSMCRINGFDLQEIIETNVRKLEFRYPNKFSQESALNRDIDAERDILEK